MNESKQRIGAMWRLACVAAVGLAARASGSTVPTLSDSPQPFSFAVLGDLHMSRGE